jgi:hypothetical protein
MVTKGNSYQAALLSLAADLVDVTFSLLSPLNIKAPTILQNPTFLIFKNVIQVRGLKVKHHTATSSSNPLQSRTSPTKSFKEVHPSSTAEDVYHAFIELQNYMECQPFCSCTDIQSVAICYASGHEQRVLLNRRHGGAMVLRQGVDIPTMTNHIWVYWTPNSESRTEQWIIPYKTAIWDEFFKMVTDAKDLQPPPLVKVTRPQKKR